MTTEYSPEAVAYARRELGMADDEPNAATGLFTVNSFLYLARGFDAGRVSGRESMREEAAQKADRQQYAEKLIPPFQPYEEKCDARARAIAGAIRVIPITPPESKED